MHPQRVESLSHAQRERLAYVEFRLYFMGEIGRPDLAGRFGVAPAGATRDLALYREIAPHNIKFDGSSKVWGGDRLREDVRWKFGAPPVSNANYAWLQHIFHHLAPNGTAGVVLANGSMSSNQSGEGDIRREMVEKDVVDCMVALPGQLFYSTQIPACLWFLARNKNPGNGWRDRRGQMLFIDARKLGTLVERTRRELSDLEIKRIADTYHAWRGEPNATVYADIPGFCKSVPLGEVATQGHVLTVDRYLDVMDATEDGEAFQEKMQRIAAVWRDQQAEARLLDDAIDANLKGIGYAS